jgi:hypothetical protein
MTSDCEKLVIARIADSVEGVVRFTLRPHQQPRQDLSQVLPLLLDRLATTA